MSTEKILTLLRFVLPHSPVIFEAGGHYGEDTIQFARLWPQGKVISFEPNPIAFRRLEESTKECSNVFSSQLAVSDYNGKATLYVCDDDDGSSSLLEPVKETEKLYSGQRVEVPCVVLDDWCKKNQVENIDFMWLDLEGLELQVLISSPGVLKGVKVIYTETNFYEYRKGVTRYGDLKSFLESRGFVLQTHSYVEHLQGDAIFIRTEERETK